MSKSIDQCFDRLDRLERENRRLRRGIGLAALLALPILLVQCRGGEEVAARRFVVRDDAGTVRASLGLEEEQVRLRLFNAEGVRLASLAISPEGHPGLALFHDAERPGALLEVGKTGPSVVLLDGKANVLFRRP